MNLGSHVAPAVPPLLLAEGEIKSYVMALYVGSINYLTYKFVALFYVTFIYCICLINTIYIYIYCICIYIYI